MYNGIRWKKYSERNLAQVILNQWITSHMENDKKNQTLLITSKKLVDKYTLEKEKYIGEYMKYNETETGDILYLQDKYKKFS